MRCSTCTYSGLLKLITYNLLREHASLSRFSMTHRLILGCLCRAAPGSAGLSVPTEALRVLWPTTGASPAVQTSRLSLLQKQWGNFQT